MAEMFFFVVSACIKIVDPKITSMEGTSIENVCIESACIGSVNVIKIYLQSFLILEVELFDISW